MDFQTALNMISNKEKFHKDFSQAPIEVYGMSHRVLGLDGVPHMAKALLYNEIGKIMDPEHSRNVRSRFVDMLDKYAGTVLDGKKTGIRTDGGYHITLNDHLGGESYVFYRADFALTNIGLDPEDVLRLISNAQSRPVDATLELADMIGSESKLDSDAYVVLGTIKPYLNSDNSTLHSWVKSGGVVFDPVSNIAMSEDEYKSLLDTKEYARVEGCHRGKILNRVDKVGGEMNTEDCLAAMIVSSPNNQFNNNVQ